MDTNKIIKAVVSEGQLEAEIARLEGELATLKEKFPCGHRRVDWDDSYGNCVACTLQEYADKYDHQLGVEIELAALKENLNDYEHQLVEAGMEVSTLRNELADLKERFSAKCQDILQTEEAWKQSRADNAALKERVKEAHSLLTQFYHDGYDAEWLIFRKALKKLEVE